MLIKKYVLYGTVITLFLISFFLASYISLLREGNMQLEFILNSTKLNEINKTIEIKSLMQQISHIHLDLFTRNLTLINITNFQFIINNDICNMATISLVVIIHSAPQNIKARDIIRESWGVPNMLNVVTRLVFLLGAPQDKEVQTQLDAENAAHKDLVQGQFSDTYANLSYKNIMGKLWVSEYCEQAEFVVKTDDDMFVDLYELYSITRWYINTTHYQRNRFLLCPVWRGLPILRDPTSKWYVSFKDIPKDEKAKEGEEFYPTSCAGWLYVTTPDTAMRLAAVAQTARFFWIDDVWVTGYLARELGIQHQDLSKYWTMKPGTILLYKSIQNPVIYHRDFISGPMDRDKSLSMALHRRARWCYLNKCFNNIYYQHPPENIEEMVNNQMINKFFPGT